MKPDGLTFAWVHVDLDVERTPRDHSCDYCAYGRVEKGMPNYVPNNIVGVRTSGDTSSPNVDKVTIIRDFLVGAGFMDNNVPSMTVREMAAYVRGRI